MCFIIQETLCSSNVCTSTAILKIVIGQCKFSWFFFIFLVNWIALIWSSLLEMVLAKISVSFSEHCMLRIHPNLESISRKLAMCISHVRYMLGYFTMLVFINWKQHLSYICFIIHETLCISNMWTRTTILKVDIDKVKFLRKPSPSFSFTVHVLWKHDLPTKCITHCAKVQKSEQSKICRSPIFWYLVLII